MLTYKLILREQVKRGEQVLPFVWAFKLKREINTKRVFKHKARLNVRSRKQEYASNFFTVFSPIVTCFIINMVLFLFITNGWSTNQMDFILAFTQANIKFNVYMDIPQGIKTMWGSRKTHVLNLLKNI